MKHITECTALSQAKEIFNNSEQDILEHFVEEFNELRYELVSGNSNDKKIEEAGDLAYMFNQVLNMIGTDYLTVLKKATIKNEKKRK